MNQACLALKVPVLVAVVALLGTSALAAGLVGTWTITVEAREGPRTSEFTVSESEGGYTGSLTGQLGTAELQSIRIEDGGDFSFSLTMETRMGDFEIVYSGTVSGDTLSGRVETPLGTRPFTGVRKE